MRVRQHEPKVRLEGRSRTFAKLLFERHPEWLPYAGHHDGEEDGLLVRYLEVRVPSQNPRVPEPLLIQTNQYEV